MNSSESALKESFHKICREIATEEDSYSANIESSYEKLLQLLADNNEARTFFANELIKSVRGYRYARDRGASLLSVDAIAYCMHELRWPEVLAAAQKEHAEVFSKKMDSMLVRLLDAFGDDWQEASA